jgi:ABC-type uncharacterized transport system permease subunit
MIMSKKAFEEKMNIARVEGESSGFMDGHKTSFVAKANSVANIILGVGTITIGVAAITLGASGIVNAIKKK